MEYAYLNLEEEANFYLFLREREMKEKSETEESRTIIIEFNSSDEKEEK